MSFLPILNTDVSRYTEDTLITDISLLKCSLERLQYKLSVSPEVYEVGNEGLISLTRKFIFGIANTFFHVANNFKTMFKAYRAFKRSELRFYKESYYFSYKYVMSLNYRDVRATPVSIPRGMRKPYLEGTTLLNKALTVLDMNKKTIALLDLITDIHRSVVTQSETQKVNRQQVTHITTLFDVNVLKRLQKDIDKCYTDTPSGEVRFDNVFASMQDFKKVGETLLEMEAYLIGVSSVCDTLEQMETLFNDIITRCEKKEIIVVKADMMALSEITLFLATIFDTYGTWIDDLNRTTHNYLLCVKKLDNKS